MPAEAFSYPRYLVAKKGVDDRALNRAVLESLARRLAALQEAAPCRVLEVGAGVGTMLERMLDWGLLCNAHYTAIDALPENMAHARRRLPRWARRRGYRVSASGLGLRLERPGQSVTSHLETADLFDFAERRRGRQAWQLLVAHAVLDLLDIPAALTALFGLLEEPGLFYFTLNFDGLTLFEPPLDPPLEERILALYHRSMDERPAGGRPSGGSRTGRRLFAQLEAAGARILESGSSDWVVFPGRSGYRRGEARFLHAILHTIHAALQGHAGLEPARLEAWVSERHAQVERGELVYIAHQLDFLGQAPIGVG